MIEEIHICPFGSQIWYSGAKVGELVFTETINNFISLTILRKAPV